MPVCQYFLQGKCNFGTRCRNEHPQTRSSAFGQSTSQAILKGGGGGATPSSAFGLGTNRFGVLANAAAPASTTATSSAFGGQQSSFSGFGRSATNAGGFLSQQQPSTTTQQQSFLRPFDSGAKKVMADKPLDSDQLRKLVTAPLIWKLSSFAPVGDKPCMISGTDVSPEESRLDFVMAQRQSGNTMAAQQRYDTLVAEMDNRLRDIAGKPQVYAAQWQQQHGGGSGAGAPQSAFGLNSSAFGTTNQQGTSAFSQKSAFGNTSSGQSSSAFSINSGASAFGTTNTSSSAFGTTTNSGASAFGTANPSSSAFGTTNTRVSAFGQPSLLMGSKATASAQISFGNSAQEILDATGPQRDLTPGEIECFRAQAFAFGSIPEAPPTPELCS